MKASTSADPFAEGYDAYLAGKPETSNPYVGINGAAEMAWNDGWCAAAEEN